MAARSAPGVQAAARPVVNAAAMTTSKGLARSTKPSTTTPMPSRTNMEIPPLRLAEAAAAGRLDHEDIARFELSRFRRAEQDLRPVDPLDAIDAGLAVAAAIQPEWAGD